MKRHRRPRLGEIPYFRGIRGKIWKNHSNKCTAVLTIYFETGSCVFHIPSMEKEKGVTTSMMNENWVYRRGDLYLADLGTPVGSRQGGVRPVIILQNDIGNYYAPTITLAPLTSKINKKKKQPTHYFLRKAKGLHQPSVVLAEQLGTYDKRCIIRYLGKVSSAQMRGIDEVVKAQLGYYIPERQEHRKAYAKATKSFAP